jgi:hypothetical protein
MRSLWRILALEWLRGDGSEALTADSAILEGLPYGCGRVQCRDNRADWVHLESLADAVLRHQDISTSPWRVTSVRQSDRPALPRRDDQVIELAPTNPRR